MSSASSKTLLKAGGGLAGLILLFAVLVAANIILGNLRVRRDLTEEKLYTLSEGTKKFLAKLEQPVTLKLFFSRSLAEVPPQLKSYARQVEDLLREYEIASKQRVVLELHDPKPDSDDEDLAQRYGVAPQDMDMFGPRLYFGLVAVAGENEGVIPVIDPRTEATLEYDIDRLISRVLNPEKPVLGVMSALPVLGDPAPFGGFRMPSPDRARPWLAFQDLKKDYTVKEVAPDSDAIPADITCLIVVHPKGFTDKALYAIDQFVLRGGRLLAFVDPLCITDMESNPQQQSPFGPPQASSTLGKLFDAWGIGFDADQVAVDLKAVSRLRTPNGQTQESSVFLSLMKDHVNRDDVLTAQLGTIILPLAGAFSDKTDDRLNVTPLLISSDMAGPVTTFSAQMGNDAIRREFKASTTPLNFAVRASGTFKTAFPDGKPKETEAGDDGKEKPAEPVAAPALKEGESTVILVADADLIFDRFCVEELSFLGASALRPLNDNLSLLGNAVEQLTGNTDLVSVRSRGSFARPFEVVRELENRARQQWQEQERMLTEKLEETRQQLSRLQAEKDKNQKFILSKEQQLAIERYRKEEANTNLELRNVRKSLRRDIDRLGVKVKLANIVLMPLLVAACGIGFGVYRRRHG